MTTRSRQTLALYISGHGYGHATRVLEVARTLVRLRPGVRFLVRSTIPEWLVRLNLGDLATFQHVEIDVGVRQRNSYFPDKLRTLQDFASLWENRSQRIKQEAAALRGSDVRLILADLPPLAFEIAEAAGVPALAMGNFSWDWIYEPYTDEHPEYRWLIPAIREAYGKAVRLFRLPMHGDLSAFPSICDVPLVARHAELPASEVRRRLGLAESAKPLLLVALRPEDLADVDWSPLTWLSERYEVVAFSPIPLPGAHILPPDFMRFQELVHAAQVVVSKPGYGIVSECIANDTALLYVERHEFREYDVLVAGLDRYGWAEKLSVQDFQHGEWADALQQLESKRQRAHGHFDTNGAEVVARALLEYLR